MSVEQLLPWLNLLLVPAVGLLLRVNGRLARLDTLVAEHGRRLDRHDSDLGTLRELIFDQRRQ